jgi:hypothetical protein
MALETAMDQVYVVMHGYENSYGDEQIKFIGVYAAKEHAEAAVERLRKQPGFCKWPEGFSVGRYEIGKDHWTEGFITWAEAMKDLD